MAVILYVYTKHLKAVTSMADTHGSITLEIDHVHIHIQHQINCQDVSTSAWKSELSADACPSDIQSARDSAPLFVSRYPTHLANQCNQTRGSQTSAHMRFSETCPHCCQCPARVLARTSVRRICRAYRFSILCGSAWECSGCRVSRTWR